MKGSLFLLLLVACVGVHQVNSFSLHHKTSPVHGYRPNSSNIHVQPSARETSLSMSTAVIKEERVPISWKSPTGQKNELTREVMAGLVVALATIPTSISYSTVIGINPITGIWNSALVGLFMTIVGGAPGKI
jgi:hypothetical protein